MPEYLFVYGTLMRGLAAHERMSPERVRYVGDGTIPGALYDLGPYPALRLGDEGMVHGEVYELVDEAMICELDEYEGYHGRPEICRYIRSAVPVDCSGGTLEAWVYSYNPRRKLEGAVLVDSGDYRKVKREGNA